MKDMPDDILVRVLSYLPLRDLLGSARAVCCRWRALASHRDVWKHCLFLNLSFEGAAKVSRALLVAPCLQWLLLDMRNVTPELGELLCTTSCVLKKLFLGSFPEADPAGTLALAIRILRHLAPHLREVSLSLGYVPQHKVVQYRELVQLVVNLNLEHLEVSAHRKGRGNQLMSGVTFGGPFLKKLTISGSLEMYFTKALIQTHSQTLVSADFHDAWYTPSFSDLIKTLPICTQLKKLSLEARTDVAKVLRSLPQLTMLSLQMNSLPYRPPKNVWKKYFRSASAMHLTYLKLWVDYNEEFFEDIWEISLACIHALASSGRSALEDLVFCGHGPEVDARSLDGVLSGLPRLRTLQVPSLPLEDFLDTLSPASAPSLRVLQASGSSGCRRPYEQRVEPVRRLLERMPDLHVVKVCLGPRLDEADENAHWCCNAELPGGEEEEDRHGFATCGLVAKEHGLQRSCVICRDLAQGHDEVYWHSLGYKTTSNVRRSLL